MQNQERNFCEQAILSYQASMIVKHGRLISFFHDIGYHVGPMRNRGRDVPHGATVRHHHTLRQIAISCFRRTRPIGVMIT
jgi:hypothetical protein